MSTGISNTCFLCGKAEDVLPELLNTQKTTADHVIGVVDPPRAGLRTLVLYFYCAPVDKDIAK